MTSSLNRRPGIVWNKALVSVLRPQTVSDGTCLGEKLLSSMTVLHLLQERLKIAFGGQNFGDWELISTALGVKKCHVSATH